MKLPLKCPLCNTIMPINFLSFGNVCSRSCDKTLTHMLCFSGNNATDDVFTIRLCYGTRKQYTAIWRCSLPYVEIISMEESVRLPFFEPDFSQGLASLVKKLHLYTVML